MISYILIWIFPSSATPSDRSFFFPHYSTLDGGGVFFVFSFCHFGEVYEGGIGRAKDTGRGGEGKGGIFDVAAHIYICFH